MFKICLLGLVLVVHASEVISSTCGISTTFLSTGYLKSPSKRRSGGFSSEIPIDNYEDYPKNMDCVYDISAPAGKAIKLTWRRFDLNGYMPTCWPKDFVEIYIGCGRQSIGKYCSTNAQRPFDIYSPDNCLRIRFKSDSSDGGKGFLAYFESFSKSFAKLPNLCGNYLKTGSYGTISSPAWPLNYPANDRSCYWSIQVGKSKNVKIAFMDFDLEDDFGCDDTKLKIKGDDDDKSYDRADKTLKDSTCGSKTPFTLTSSEERIYIRFKTSYTNYNNRGFVAGYMLYEPSIHDTGSKITIIVVCVIIAIIVIGCVVFFCVRRRRNAQRAHQPAIAMAPATQSYPMQPPPAQMNAAPPSYGQATSGPYPPPGSYPVQSEKQGPYPPPAQPYPPPAQPYPPPAQPYPPPTQPYPLTGAPQYPDSGAAPPYPATNAPPYPATGAPSYPPPGQAQPYPPPGQPTPYPPT